MSYVVAAVWKALPGEEEEVLDIIRELTPLTLAEPQCLDYRAHISTAEPGTFLLYEVYTDPSGYDAHKASPHFQRLVAGDALARLADRTVTTYTPVQADA